MQARIISIILSLLIATKFMGQAPIIVKSPNGKVVANVQLVNNQLQYQLSLNGQVVIKPSKLGLLLKEYMDDHTGYSIVNTSTKSFNEVWQPVLGEQRNITNNYNELTVATKSNGKNGVLLHIIFRVYNEGLGFRYYFPTQEKVLHAIVAKENSEFGMTDNHKAYWIPGDYDSNEYPYTESNLQDIHALQAGAKTEIHARQLINDETVQTPLMMKGLNGFYMNIHEAALVNYPAMQLTLNKSNNTFSSTLTPDAVGNYAYIKLPFATPWRAINVATTATEILSSKLILNLNDPNVLTDVSYIKPMKYVGVWWEMHIGKSTWDYAGTQDMGSWENLANLKPTGKHGATTENVKRYIDFASKHGFGGVLVEGWNAGWEDWFGKWKENVFDFVTPYPDFDVAALQRYANSKNVKMIMHHETSGAATNYDQYMDTAYKFMTQFGYPAVKTGYVGRIIPRGEHHDGQWMQNHFRRAYLKAAQHKILINMHESTRPTGLHRTYPNWIANEAARGTEFNAWSNGNDPSHETILPFTRLMGGPMDYTPGIFKMKLNYADSRKTETMHTTLAKQLALYVTMYSPLQMAADLPENYEAKPDALQFIKDVALDWDTSIYLQAEPNQFITVARKEKNAKNWFIGSITNQDSRTVTLPLNYLDAGQNYEATIYMDDPKANYTTNQELYIVKKQIVSKLNSLKIQLAPGGGFAISLKPVGAKIKIKPGVLTIKK
jgi:glucan 1,4-alpha-glucosidase